MYTIIIITLIFFIIIISFFIIKKYLHMDIFSPFALIIYFWIIPLCISQIKISYYQTKWDISSSLVILCVTVIMLTLSLIFSFYAHKHWNSNLFAHKLEMILNNKYLYFISIIILIINIILIIIELKNSGIPLFQYITKSAETTKLHKLNRNEIFHIFIFFNRIIIPLLFLYFLKLKKRKFLLFLILVSIFLGVLRTSKLDIATILFSMIAVYYYWNLTFFKEKIKKLLIKITVFVFVFSMFFVLITYIRSQGTIFFLKTYSENIGFIYNNLNPFLKEYISILYGYTAMNFENFVRYFQTHDPSYIIGLSFFKPIFNLFFSGDYIKQFLEKIDWNYISPVATVGTYMRPIYAELGIIGLIVATLIYSLMFNFIYYKFITLKSFFWFILYIQMIFLIMFMLFMNPFSVLNVFINMLLFTLIFKFSLFLKRIKKNTY